MEIRQLKSRGMTTQHQVWIGARDQKSPERFLQLRQLPAQPRLVALKAIGRFAELFVIDLPAAREKIRPQVDSHEAVIRTACPEFHSRTRPARRQPPTF